MLSYLGKEIWKFLFKTIMFNYAMIYNALKIQVLFDANKYVSVKKKL